MAETDPNAYDTVSAPDPGAQLVRDPPSNSGGEGKDDKPEPDESTKLLVKEWQKKILAKKEKDEKAFKQMRTNMEFARKGAPKDHKGYIVPLTARHINQKVSTLYAKKPTVSAELKRKVYFKIWDEDPNTFMAAVQQIEQATVMGQDPNAVAPDAMAIVQEVAQAKTEELMMRRMAKTAEIVADYYLSPRPVKRRMKQMVRRACITKVGYLDLSFQREMQPDPAIVAQIDGHLSTLRRVESMIEEQQEGEIEDPSAELAKLKSTIASLQAAPQVITREGPVFDFPRSNEIIVADDCRQLHGFDGASWLVREWKMSKDRVKDLFKVDVDKYTPYKDGTSTQDSGSKAKAGSTETKGDICVWRVQDKELGQEFFIADGYEDYIKPPAEPEMLLDRFFTVFSFVPNDVEDDQDLYPPSDVEWMMPAQNEMNDVRQRLHEHRLANVPGWVNASGAMDDEEKKLIENRAAFKVITLKQMMQGGKVKDLLDAFPTVTIDPNLYADKPIMDDVLRSVGSSEAQLGAPQSNTTATSSSIAENSRQSSDGSNVDDLDDFLTEVVESMHEANLLYMSLQTVQEIAGVNAVWPDQASVRNEAVKKLGIKVQAGSSGRINAAAALANMERAIPYILRMPNVNPAPIVRRFSELLDLPVDEMTLEGAPSTEALNAMVSKAVGQAQAAGQGGAPNGAQKPPAGRQAGPQAAHPAPGAGVPGGPGAGLPSQ